MLNSLKQQQSNFYNNFQRENKKDNYDTTFSSELQGMDSIKQLSFSSIKHLRREEVKKQLNKSKDDFDAIIKGCTEFEKEQVSNNLYSLISNKKTTNDFIYSNVCLFWKDQNKHDAVHQQDPIQHQRGRNKGEPGAKIQHDRAINKKTGRKTEAQRR